jgi:hypothetical protein
VVILLTFFALASGFTVTVLLSLGLTALAARLVSGWRDSAGNKMPSFFFVHLGFSLLSAATGGYVTSWIATGNPLIQVLALALVLLLFAAMSALQARGKYPIWFLLAQVAITPLGVLAGGLLRLRVLGIL